MKNTDNVDLVCSNYDKVIKSIKKDCTEIFKVIDSARNIYVYGVGMIQSSVKKELRRAFMLRKNFMIKWLQGSRVCPKLCKFRRPFYNNISIWRK